MKVKLITTASDFNNPGLITFKKSLDKFGWDYEVLGGDYVAYGSKMVNAYYYAKGTDCTHLFIADAYDVVVLATMEEALAKIPHGKIVFSSEKACWPYENWAKLYPEIKSEWKYLNGGLAFVEVASFIKMFEENPICHEDNDQVKLAEVFLKDRNQYDFVLDTECDVFQSYSHLSEDDFQYKSNGRIYNAKNKTYPVFVHFNGKTDGTKVLELL